MVRNNEILALEREAFVAQTDNLVARIVFSHGFFVDRFARQIMGGHTNNEGYCDYCSISAIKFDKDGENILLNASDEHVITKGAPFE
jgi:hypothetical protein